MVGGVGLRNGGWGGRGGRGGFKEWVEGWARGFEFLRGRV
jgi:hypothetical protein